MNSHFSRLIFTTVLSALCCSAGAGITVSNFKEGDEVRHSVVLIRGAVDGNVPVMVRQTGTGTPPKTITPLMAAGKFKALVELTPGQNLIEFQTQPPGAPLKLRLNLKPATDPHYVRLIWLTDKSGATDYATPEDGFPQNYEDRLRTAALALQCFTAERMFELGYGRRTFNLKTDNKGKVIVETIKAPKDADYYYSLTNDQQWWQETNSYLNTRYPDPNVKNLVLAAFTRKDPETGKMKAHTALGGGNLGLFGSASVFSWPDSVEHIQTTFMNPATYDVTRVHDDSVGRKNYWGLASTTMGATLHEMSHSFGLPHCKEPRDIMTRGFDRLNRFFTFSEPFLGKEPKQFTAESEAWFAPISAAFLRWSPWFQADSPRNGKEEKPQIEFDDKKQIVEFSGRTPLRVAGFWEGGDIRSFSEFKEPAPKKISMTMEEINVLMEGKPLSKITVMDEAGRTASFDVKKQP